MITFQNIGLSEEILRALDELGFKEPTPIQAEAIPYILENETDLIALAQTGTGKTAAYSLPMIHHIDQDMRAVQALILCPTRELCMQIAKDIKSFSKYMKDIDVAAVYGGASASQQIRDLQRGAQIVVGTPGRALDLIKRGKLRIEDVGYVALDEADEMLDMGFKDDLDAILSETPEEKQIVLFSATMPRSVLSIANTYMKQPDQISVGKESAGADLVDHMYYMVQARDRYQALKRIADVNPDIYAIVFCRTRRETNEVADKLIQDHYSAEAIHGDLSQDQRTNVMNRFKAKKVQILVATDVAARGIDVNDLTHVINYNLPDTLDTYIHRSGRTGRAQKSGTSIAIIHTREGGKIRALERKVGKKFVHSQVPKGSDICRSQLFTLINKVKSVQVEEEQIGSYLPEVNDQLKELSREDLIKKFVSVEFNRFLADYKDAPDLNSTSAGRDRGGFERGGRRERTDRERGSGMSMSSVSLNLGRNDGFGVKDLFGLVNRQPKLKGVEIGSIEIKGACVILEVDSNRKDDFVSGFKGQSHRGKKLIAKMSREGPKRKFR